MTCFSSLYDFILYLDQFKSSKYVATGHATIKQWIVPQLRWCVWLLIELDFWHSYSGAKVFWLTLQIEKNGILKEKSTLNGWHIIL